MKVQNWENFMFWRLGGWSSALLSCRCFQAEVMQQRRPFPHPFRLRRVPTRGLGLLVGIGLCKILILTPDFEFGLNHDRQTEYLNIIVKRPTLMNPDILNGLLRRLDISPEGCDSSNIIRQDCFDLAGVNLLSIAYLLLYYQMMMGL